MIYNTDKSYIKYNEDILNHGIVANKLILQACQRMKSWFERTDIYFDYDDVDRKVRFMQKLKHSKGTHAGKQFQLLPYQQWITANIIGWKWKDTNTRVINTALLMLSRKAGKTFFASALMLAIILTDGEKGAEGYMIANSAQQASIAFTHCTEQCSSIDRKAKLFSRYRSEIRIPIINSKIKILSSDTSTLDGLNPSVFIVDEYHEAKTDELFNILRTGQGMRANPLGCIITTAGFNATEDYPLYRMWVTACNILNGTFTQDTFFAALYQLDDDDDWKDESVWIKSNPTLGETVSYKYLREQVTQAINNPMSEVSIKTKNFNCWCNSAETWISYEQVKKCTKSFQLSDFNSDEDYCLIGIDLSETGDITAVTTLVYKDEKYWFKAFCYLPRTGLENSPNKELYKHWISKGYLYLIDEPIINQEYILEKIKEINDIVPVAYVAYDPWRARQLANKLVNEGLPVHKIPQSIGQFSEATQELYNLVMTEQVYIDDNPIIRWMFANVLIKEDANQNKKPIKSSHHAKIDAIIGFIQTLKLWIEVNGGNDAANEVITLD